jgi:hypothetical protein
MKIYYSGQSFFGRMMKKAASFVLVSPTSSIYPEGTPAVVASSAASLDNLFDHPARFRRASSRVSHGSPTAFVNNSVW